MRLAGELGARGVIISPGKASPLFAAPEEELFGYFFAALDHLCPIAASSGTALWLENVPTTWIPTIGGLMAALKRYGSDAVRMIYDVANAHFIDEDIADGLKQCRERLELVHFSDTGQKIFRHDPSRPRHGAVRRFAESARRGRLYARGRCWKSFRTMPTATSWPAPIGWRRSASNAPTERNPTRVIGSHE